MLGHEVSTWIWREKIVWFALAAVMVSACQPSNDSVATDVAESAPLLPQTPKSIMDDLSGDCRIRDEIPADNVTTLTLPELDPQVLQEQDQNPPKDAPLLFATSIEVNIDPSAYGKWEQTDAVQLWRVKIISPQALSLSMGFTTFDMPEGGCLFLYSPDQAQILGPYTNADNAEHGQLWTPTVEGEEVLIEISLPEDQVSKMQLVLGFINQGYR